MTKNLHGKVALITGASKGLGKAMALALAESGARLALVSRNLEQLNETAAAVRKRGAEAGVFQADVTDEQQVRRVEKGVVEKFGNVQILINNAGINLRKTVTDFTLEEWRQVMDTNVTSVFLLCRSIVPHMKGLGCSGQPEEVGQLAVYLCSEDASYITGTDFLLDGGWPAQ